MYLKTNLRQSQRGVSLLEVLISIVVIAVGILGLAKMQALSIANTQLSASRGLVALQASSLAATMHANPNFWQVASPATPPCYGVGACSISATTTSTSLPSSFPTVSSTCSGYPSSASTCSSGQMATLDLTTWMGVMGQQVPTYTLNINCGQPGQAGIAVGPSACSITITWLEKAQGMNQTTAALADATPYNKQTYVLYVQP